MSKKLGPTIKHKATRGRDEPRREGGRADLERAERDAKRPDYNPGVVRRGGGGVKNRKDHRANVRSR